MTIVYTQCNRDGISVAGYCPVKAIPPNKFPIHGELKVTEDIQDVIENRRIERFAAFKELRALDLQIKDITGD